MICLKNWLIEQNHIEKVNEENLETLKSSGMDSYLLDYDNLTTDQLLKLKENKILTRDQLADLSSFELIEILTELDNDKADKIIIDSRQHWFKD